MLVIVAPAVAVNVAAVAPEDTVTEAGTVRSALLLPSVTAIPPVGAAELRLTEQLDVLLALRLVGLHVTDDTVGTVITPDPADVTVIALPVLPAPTGLDTASVVVLALDARVI